MKTDRLGTWALGLGGRLDAMASANAAGLALGLCLVAGLAFVCAGGVAHAQDQLPPTVATF